MSGETGSDRSRDSSVGWLVAVVPFMSTIVALLFGMLIGGTVGWYAQADQGLAGVMSGASLADLQAACQPIVEEQKVRLTEIRAELTGLQGEVSDREAEVAQLRARLGEPGLSPTDQSDLESQLEVAQMTLEETKLQVRSLQRAKDKLVDQLTATQNQLKETEADLQAEAAIREALQSERSTLVERAVTNRWFRMINEAQLDICEKGGKRRTEACRQAVVDALKGVRRQFVHCLRSNQAVPSVHELKRGAEMPSHARALESDDKSVQGYYVQLCDPTLPERTLPDGVTD